MTGGGGSVGAILTQLIFFRGTRFSKETGIVLMGVMMLACTLPVWLIYFPQWGGMLAGGAAGKGGGASEESYYLSEWSEEEKEKGLHHGSLKFAGNTRGERGRRVSSVATPPPETPVTAGV